MEKQILFVDQIGVTSILKIIILFRSAKSIWYFEPITPFFQRFLDGIQKIGLFPADIHQVNYHIGQIRNDNGANGFGDCRRLILNLCKQIKQEQLLQNPLIKGMGKEWTPSKLLLYFEQLTEKEVNEEYLRIGLTKWILQTKLSVNLEQGVLLIKRRQWFSYIKEYADSNGIGLVPYLSWDFSIKFFKRLTFYVSKLLKQFSLQPKKTSVSSSTSKKRLSEHFSKTTVAINYWHRTLNFDSMERSEFFWIEKSGIPMSDILLYNYVSSNPIASEIQQQLDQRGIRLLGNCPGVPSYKFTPLILTTIIRNFRKIIKIWFVTLIKKQKASFYYLTHLIQLAIEFAQSYDFYTINQVRINIGTHNTTVGQTLAMDALGIVSCSFQYSAANICYPHYRLTAGEDVFFMFSSSFEDVWRIVEAPVANYVKVGFIYDAAFQEVRSSDRMDVIRRDLQNHGVKFILCFFDENSVDKWGTLGSHKEAADDYEYLLQWLSEDPTLGMIFKPKRFMDLFQRIGNTSKLIKQAEATGRCKMIHDNYGNSFSPGEVALIADTCIGKVSGVTAALEARLIGTPTVLIDTANLYFHPFYSWATEDVLFNDWKALRSSVEQFRANPESHPKFGDWGVELDGMDHFQDGKASLRMGSYIGNVYDALKSGKSKQFALQSANENFQSQLGIY
jgi:hypothetical protein